MTRKQLRLLFFWMVTGVFAVTLFSILLTVTPNDRMLMQAILVIGIYNLIVNGGDMIRSLKARTFWMGTSYGWGFETDHLHLGRLIFFWRIAGAMRASQMKTVHESYYHRN